MKFLRGIVIRGDSIGKLLGFPTANLDIPIEKTGLRDAVYAAYATLRGKKYAAAAVIQTNLNKVEVRLLDYEGDDFYGEELEVEMVERVSDFQVFNSFKQLSTKIAQDIGEIKKVLEEL